MRYLFAILSLLAVLGTLAVVKASQFSMMIGAGEAMKKAGPPPETVSAVEAGQQSWENVLNSVGTVTAGKGVSVSSDVAGVVNAIHFDSGATVKRGQILVELDSSVERAQLQSLRARRDLAESSLRRSQALVESGALAPAQAEADDTNYRSLGADVRALEAQIAKKTIRAPFAGKLGIREVNLGQFIAPGTAIASLESSQSTFVDFTLPQERVKQLSTGMKVRALLPNHETEMVEGSITAIAPEVDAVARNVKVRAALPESQGRLRPGMFTKVAVVLPENQKVLAIPSTAVVHATYGDSVFCIDESPPADANSKPRLVARQQFVKLGETRGDFVAVLDGLKPGERVAVAGAFKLRNGVPVVINNQVELKPELTPKPANR